MFYELMPNAVDELGDASQTAQLFQYLAPRIRQSAELGDLTGVQFDERLREAEMVVADLAEALTANVKERTPGLIWSAPKFDDLGGPEADSKKQNWSEPSPVNRSMLDKAAAAYLDRPWMQLNFLDWCILNGYIFDEVASTAVEAKPGPTAQTVDWAYLFSEGDYGRNVLWRIAFKLSEFLIRWIVIPLAILLIYYWESQEAATWLASLYTLYLVVHVAISPRDQLDRRSIASRINEHKRIHDLIGIYRNSSVDVVHPARLLDLISSAERHNAVFRPAVYSILDRAIARDGTVLAVEDVR